MTRRIPLGQVADAVLSGQLGPGSGPALREARFCDAARAVRTEITKGIRPAGSVITVPEVRSRHQLARHSAQRLRRQLTREKLLRRQPGDGYYVTGGNQ